MRRGKRDGNQKERKKIASEWYINPVEYVASQKLFNDCWINRFSLDAKLAIRCRAPPPIIASGTVTSLQLETGGRVWGATGRYVAGVCCYSVTQVAGDPHDVTLTVIVEAKRYTHRRAQTSTGHYNFSRTNVMLHGP